MWWKKKSNAKQNADILKSLTEGKNPDAEALVKMNEPTEDEIKKFKKLVDDQNELELGYKRSQMRMNNSYAFEKLYLNPLAEIRLALNFGQIAEGDTGLSERVKIDPMFDETDRKRLQKRYFKILDEYMKKVIELDPTVE